jgi:hypothetical protein
MLAVFLLDNCLQIRRPTTRPLNQTPEIQHFPFGEISPEPDFNQEYMQVVT